MLYDLTLGVKPLPLALSLTGKREGQWQWLNPEGQIVQQGSYRMGLRTGEWKRLHGNGQAAEVGQYTDGKRSGQWDWLAPDGILVRRAQYLNGREQKAIEPARKTP